mgnify:CR=1 FL=1
MELEYLIFAHPHLFPLISELFSRPCSGIYYLYLKDLNSTLGETFKL